MLVLACMLLVLVLVVSHRIKGPLWAMGFAWLTCLVPVATGIVTYTYLSQWDVGYVVSLAAFLGCFSLGAFWHDQTARSSSKPIRRAATAELRAAYPWAYAALCAATVGTICIGVDYTLLEGAGLDDLAALREVYVTRETTVFARLGSVLTWGCLYCFAFALTFRDQLPKLKFAAFLLPIGGFFLVALFSAGRQAAMQILIFALLTLALKRTRQGPRKAKSQSGAAIYIAISVAMIGYMGYIASARNDNLISEDKVEVLSRLFDFELSTTLEWLLSLVGESVRTGFVEGMVYFSSSIALFSKFLTIDFPKQSYGAMSLPFIMRQLEPLTGISVVEALNGKIEQMRNLSVIGVGWTTAISSYVMDFGKLGAGVVLCAQGYYSAFSWRRARLGTDFHEGVIALIMLTAAIYMPLTAASGETNLLLLWLYCVFVLKRGARHVAKRAAKRIPLSSGTSV